METRSMHFYSVSILIASNRMLITHRLGTFVAPFFCHSGALSTLFSCVCHFSRPFIQSSILWESGRARWQDPSRIPARKQPIQYRSLTRRYIHLFCTLFFRFLLFGLTVLTYQYKQSLDLNLAMSATHGLWQTEQVKVVIVSQCAHFFRSFIRFSCTETCLHVCMERFHMAVKT